jgi:hypothetical protein
MKKLILSGEVGSIRTEQVYSVKRNAHTNAVSRFFKWCESQEGNRFLWLALTYIAQIGLALPLTMFVIVFFANVNFTLLVLTCIVNVPALVINLAAQPTKVSLPVLFFAWASDAIIILFCAVNFLLH